MTDDVRDIAGGVREGMQLTKQDLQAQTKNWRSAFGARWRSFAQEKEEPKDTDGDAKKEDVEATATGLQAVRHNIAVTADVSKDMWRDVKELKEDPTSSPPKSVGYGLGLSSAGLYSQELGLVFGCVWIRIGLEFWFKLRSRRS